MRDAKCIRVPSLALLLMLSACTSVGSGTAPDDMSVAGHRSHSQEMSEKASEHRDRYDPDAEVERLPGRPSRSEMWGGDSNDRYNSGNGYRYSGDYYWQPRTYNPTERHLAHATRHEAHAREHAEAARSLESFEDDQCGSFPHETRMVCPLIGQLASVEDIPGGSRVRFADGVDVNAAVAHIRCHLAFARSQGRAGMESCPLYLEGVRVSRVGPGSDVDFLVEDSNDLAALRERIRAHVVDEAH